MATPFREAMRPEIEALARERAYQRMLDGEGPDPFADWVEAEQEVLKSHAYSPARLMPGGDLFPYEDEDQEPN